MHFGCYLVKVMDATQKKALTSGKEKNFVIRTFHNMIGIPAERINEVDRSYDLQCLTPHAFTKPNL